jgi:hypothetical protein
MLGIILTIAPCFFIWRYFAELAHEHNRSRAGFGILGIVVYFASQIILEVILGLILIATSGPDTYAASDALLFFGGIVLGILAVWLFYVLLKKSWERKALRNNSELLDN